MDRLLRAVVLALVTSLIASGAPAQSIRDRIRLKPEERTPITEEQANELTLTLNAATVRPIQIWVRTAGTMDTAGRVITAKLPAHEAMYVKAGQRVRVFPPESRSSMFQAIVSRVTPGPTGTSVSVTLSGPAYRQSARWVMEIVTEPLEALSVPNEAIIEAEGKRIVYVEEAKGRYRPAEIEPGVQGELYTEVRGGLKDGDQVVTFGSFFIDADHHLKGL
jgi:multidrug efflux pump subunit AcrA (membrane-fusion protein)